MKVINFLFFIVGISLEPLLPKYANAAVEVILDGVPVMMDSAVYVADQRAVIAEPATTFECSGPQAQIGDGLVLQVDNESYLLQSVRFNRANSVTQIIATTPGELPTCGPEGLLFQDYFE